MASVVVNTFPQAFLQVLLHSLQHVGRNCCHFFPDFLFQIHRCPWVLFVHLALEISSEEEVLRLWTLVPMNIEVPTKYSLSQDRIVVFENRLHSQSPMLYRPALHGNSNALSLARRALKDKFPTPNIPLTTVLPNRQVFLPEPVDENSSLLGYYTARNGNFLPTFWNNLSVSFLLFKNLNITLKMGPIGCPETSVRNGHYSLRNNPEQRGFYHITLYHFVFFP